MAEPKGQPCPQCGAHRGTDRTPSCACGRRASDALRDARTAEQAAAEDFNPLRIRPYVDLDAGGGASSGADDGASEGESKGESEAGSEGEAEPGATPLPSEASNASNASNAAETTMVLHAVTPSGHEATPEPAAEADTASPRPTPLAPSSAEPSAGDLRMFEAGGRQGATGHGPVPSPSAPDPSDGAAGRGPRRRRTVLLGAAAAVVAVVAAAGLANGVFSYDTPSRDDAMPQDVREAVPEAEPGAESSSAQPATGAPASTAPTSTAPSPSASDSASASASPTSASPSASSSPTTEAPATTRPPTTAAATATVGPREEDTPTASAGPVLRRGDRGPEVTELQQRLRQLWLFNGDANGYYSRHLEDAVSAYQWTRGIDTDEHGVYDAGTRARLEAETAEP
ncbi:peptidoglycan-binding domain-containing protein [Streptomyces sp. B93]|uniref:peptidoglycan-binding domain-containing protein n=1 Tax=Streptomyces sp. B93 TaxID=2824875 RepID=UPI001B398326|nr:peptidoglycan-binding domain-containing protein [Streptomyces sp. B93]MBQ1094152.1 peptidoglycan-binding protein [Streptomyces sp. B93]